MNDSKVDVIDTNDSNNYQFPDIEVLDSIAEREKRKDNLYLGMILGTNYKRNVSLVVLTISGMKEIIGTIWATTEHNIILKGGTKIPVKCIKEVRIS